MSSAEKGYRFGDFLIQPSQNTIYRDGTSKQLSPRVMNVLVYLVANHDRVISSDELLGALWQGRVVEESTIHRHINLIRTALGDSSREPIYIKTISKRGYQAISPVFVIEDVRPEVATFSDEFKGPLETPENRAVRFLTRYFLPGLLASLLIVGLAAGYWVQRSTQPGKDLDLVLDREGKEFLRSVAVLPLTNLSDNAQVGYFGEGLVDLILNELADSSKLNVASRTEAFQLARDDVALRELAAKLGVAYVLEGSVQHLDGQIRVTAQLIRAVDRFHIWSKIYDRDLKAGMDVQREFGENIAYIAKTYIEADIRRQHPALYEEFDGVKPEAVRFYLDSEMEYNRFVLGEAGDAKYAMELMEKAARIDPDFLAAHKELAWNYTYRIDPELSLLESSRRAHMAMDKVLAKAPNSVDTLFYLSQVYFLLDLDYASAESTVQQGMEISPKGRWWRVFLAHIASREGRTAEAIRLMSMSSNTDFGEEKSAFLMTFARALFADRQYQRCIDMTNEVLTLVGSGALRVEAQVQKVRALIELGRKDEAKILVDSAWAAYGSRFAAQLGHAYILIGETDRGRRLLEAGKRLPMNRAAFAFGYTALGEYESALEIIRAGINDHDASIIDSIRLLPYFDELRNDDRFIALLARLDVQEIKSSRYEGRSLNQAKDGD